MVALTDKQRQVLRFIAEGIRDKSRAPTIREICTHLGVSSTNSAATHLRALVKKGMLAAALNCHHGVTLTDLGWVESGVSRTATRRVLIAREGDAYTAALGGMPAVVSAFGTTAEAALGRLVGIAPAAFGIEIVTAGAPAGDGL